MPKSHLLHFLGVAVQYSTYVCSLIISYTQQMLICNGKKKALTYMAMHTSHLLKVTL